MYIKKIVLVLIVAISLYAIETNASTKIKANKCTLGLLPFGSTMFIGAQKEAIVSAYEAKGFFVSVLTNTSEVSEVEFISDASVECTSTYFGTMAKTTIRLVETETNKIITRAVSPAIMDLWNCKVEVVKAIELLPKCEID